MAQDPLNDRVNERMNQRRQEKLRKAYNAFDVVAGAEFAHFSQPTQIPAEPADDHRGDASVGFPPTPPPNECCGQGRAGFPLDRLLNDPTHPGFERLQADLSAIPCDAPEPDDSAPIEQPAPEKPAVLGVGGGALLVAFCVGFLTCLVGLWAAAALRMMAN